MDNIANQVNEADTVRESEQKKIKKQLREERLANEIEKQKSLEQAAYEEEQLEHFYIEPEQVEHLYDAVNASNYKEVVEILHLDKTKSKVRPEHKLKLQEIAKKRGDKKIFKYLDRH